MFSSSVLPYKLNISPFLLALSVSAFPKPKQDVPPQCIDPTFACQDLKSATLCGVVKDCVHDVWATMSAPDDNVSIYISINEKLYKLVVFIYFLLYCTTLFIVTKSSFLHSSC